MILRTSIGRATVTAFALVAFASTVGSARHLAAQDRATVRIATGDYSPAPLARDAEVQSGTTLEVGRGIVVLEYYSDCGGQAIYLIIRESAYTTTAELDCEVLQGGKGDELRRAMRGESMADLFIFYSPPVYRCESPPCPVANSGLEDILAALEDLSRNPMPATKQGRSRSFGPTVGRTVPASARTQPRQQKLKDAAGLESMGPFAIVAAHSGRCLGVPGASLESGLQLVQWNCNGSSDQRWYLRPSREGRYEVVNVNSGKCMDVYGLDTGDTAAVIQWDCNDQDNQLWDVRTVDGVPVRGPSGPSGTYQMVARHSGKCIDVAGISMFDGALFHQVSCLGSQQRNQLFFLRR